MAFWVFGGVRKPRRVLAFWFFGGVRNQGEFFGFLGLLVGVPEVPACTLVVNGLGLPKAGLGGLGGKHKPFQLTARLEGSVRRFEAVRRERAFSSRKCKAHLWRGFKGNHRKQGFTLLAIGPSFFGASFCGVVRLVGGVPREIKEN